MRGMRLPAIAAAVSLLVLVAFPASSLGAPRPPANPEVDQYYEDLPKAGGDEGIDRSEGGAGGGGSVPGATVNELNSLGAEGKATAELARATAPGGVEPSSGASGGAGTDPVEVGEDGGSAAAGVLGALTGSVLLLIFLAATAALGLAYLLLWRSVRS